VVAGASVHPENGSWSLSKSMTSSLLIAALAETEYLEPMVSEPASSSAVAKWPGAAEKGHPE